jgi:hypothetical protein
MLQDRFAPEEDSILCRFVLNSGTRAWDHAASLLPGRTARQCRDRWRHYLQGTYPNSSWTDFENTLFWKVVALAGPKWNEILPLFRGKTQSDLRRHWVLGTGKPSQSLPETRPTEATKDKPECSVMEETIWRDNDAVWVANDRQSVAETWF